MNKERKEEIVSEIIFGTKCGLFLSVPFFVFGVMMNFLSFGFITFNNLLTITNMILPIYLLIQLSFPLCLEAMRDI